MINFKTRPFNMSVLKFAIIALSLSFLCPDCRRPPEGFSLSYLEQTEDDVALALGDPRFDSRHHGTAYLVPDAAYAMHWVSGGMSLRLYFSGDGIVIDQSVGPNSR